MPGVWSQFATALGTQDLEDEMDQMLAVVFAHPFEGDRGAAPAGRSSRPSRPR